MDVILVMLVIPGVSNPVIGESALPDFPLSAKYCAQRMRRSALNELNGMFERYVFGGSEQQVDMLWHNDESVELIATVPAVTVESCQEDSCVVLDNKKPSAPPSAEGYKVSSGGRNESSGLQDRTSAAKAASLA
jgi:hypothetical protein